MALSREKLGFNTRRLELVQGYISQLEGALEAAKAQERFLINDLKWRKR
jgi:hypothetical protein